MLINVEDPKNGRRPDGTFNGLWVSEFDEKSFSVRMIALLLEPDGEILFISPRGEVSDKILEGLKDIFKYATIHCLDDEQKKKMDSHIFTSGV